MEHIKANSDPCWFVLEDTDDKACVLHGEQASTTMSFPDELQFSCYGSEEDMLAGLEARDLICTHIEEEFS
tara:strand:+ start:4250 stop:4462 length:213 start_codon:yes stop_codon:yes gene_type:complete